MTPDGAFCLLASCVLSVLAGFSAHFGAVYVAAGFAAAGAFHALVLVFDLAATYRRRRLP